FIVYIVYYIFFFFFFQAEDGIRDFHVTGVQTCALPILNFGTCEHETAVTIFAPSLAIPPASYFRPTMNPVMFCRNTSGMPRWLHSSTKCAPFCADSENRMPLFAR